MTIAASSTLSPIARIDSATPASADGSNFADVIASAINDVETSRQSAQTAAMNLLGGGSGDVHNVALASQKAELAFELFQQVRNKFVQAYQEIMKTPM